MTGQFLAFSGNTGPTPITDQSDALEVAEVIFGIDVLRFSIGLIDIVVYYY
jgi:hypothetical protein